MGLIRAVALNVIKSLVPLQLPGAKVIHYLQQMNLTYRRTTMLYDIRAAHGRVKYETQIRKLKPGAKVPDAWKNTEKLGAPYNYRVHMEVEYYDESSQQIVKADRFMFEDEDKTLEEYENDYPDYSGATSDPEGIQYLGSTVVGVTKNMRPGEAPF